MEIDRHKEGMKEESKKLRQSIFKTYQYFDITETVHAICGHYALERANIFALILIEKLLKAGLTGNKLQKAAQNLLAIKFNLECA